LKTFFFADHLSKEGDDQRQEAAEERHKAVQLDYHAEHRPAQQHRNDSAQEGRGSLQSIPLREKGEGLVQSQTAGQSLRTKRKLTSVDTGTFC
jgi:hypothetical protein